MTNKKNDMSEITNDMLFADIMLRLTAMENLLLSKGLFTKEELVIATEDIAKKIEQIMLAKASTLKTVEELISSL
jgi:hypothetical protein